MYNRQNVKECCYQCVYNLLECNWCGKHDLRDTTLDQNKLDKLLQND